ncbi:unnamed protein product [Brassica rapa]|uniref:Uncharacterized protein n=1 Tax=Brassica campestris TaxID=3711 RepID=A0A8D9HPG4_BRACM|nr:unnamed protein product [Brassica rapa]
MIAITLFDMHECGEKGREVKRFNCISSGKIDDDISKPSFEDEPISPFVFFLEDFRKSYDGNMVDASRICFIVWKNMSEEVISRCVKHGLSLPVFKNLVGLSFRGDNKRCWNLLPYLIFLPSCFRPY